MFILIFFHASQSVLANEALPTAEREYPTFSRIAGRVFHLSPVNSELAIQDTRPTAFIYLPIRQPLMRVLFFTGGQGNYKNGKGKIFTSLQCKLEN